MKALLPHLHCLQYLMQHLYPESNQTLVAGKASIYIYMDDKMRDAQLIPVPASISYDVYTLRLLSSFYIRVSICFSEPVRNHYTVFGSL